MKIRNGFVSNSSSSSFIIRLKEVPTSVDHLLKMLKLSTLDNIDYYGDDVDIETVLNIIYNDIINELGNNPESKKFNNLLLDGNDFRISEYSPNKFDNFIIPEYKEEYLKIKNAIIKLSKSKYIEQLRMYGYEYHRTSALNELFLDLINKCLSKKFSNCDDYFIELSYADEDGSIMGYIEHSGILNPITFMKFSHH